MITPKAYEKHTELAVLQKPKSSIVVVFYQKKSGDFIDMISFIAKSGRVTDDAALMIKEYNSMISFLVRQGYIVKTRRKPL